MKVSDANTTNAAAVLGYQNVVGMTMDDSPEFIAIFQKNLYQHHTLAFVRETLTNAWDAHIDAGLTDTPIEVSLSTEQGFIIKDKGFGIAPDMMQQVYGIIGRGTKAGDNRSTGGFGLGCKSPHGYVDAFQVESCHAGTKTIYQIVKASELTGGKPAIITIMSMPTEDTGLTVTIPIMSKDQGTINRYIRNIVYGGDFPCMYAYDSNPAELLPTMNLSTEPSSFIMHTSTTSKVDLPTAPNLCIRYANIVYPLPMATEEHASYAKAYDMVTRWQSSLSKFTHSTPQIIIQAEAGTLSIQPSRESLSTSTATLNKLCELINNTFIRYNAVLDSHYAQYRAMYLDACKKAVETQTASYLGAEVFSNMLVDASAVLGTKECTYNSICTHNRELLQKSYRNADDLVRHLVFCTALNDEEKEHLFIHYNRACEEAGLFHSGWVDKVYKLLTAKRSNFINGDELLDKTYSKLDINSLCSLPNVKAHAAFYHTRRQSYEILEYVDNNLSALHLHKALAFGSRKVVLTTNLRQTDSRLLSHIKHRAIGEWEALLVIYTPRGKYQLPAIRQQIIDSGYELIDLSVWAAWENKPVAVRKSKPVITVTDLATKGSAYPLSTFADSFNRNNSLLCLSKSKKAISTTPDMLTDPEYVFLFERKGSDTKCSDSSIPNEVVKLLSTEVGDKLGVVFTKRDYNALCARNTEFTPMQILMDYLEARWKELKPTAIAYKKSLLPSREVIRNAGVPNYSYMEQNILHMFYANPALYSSLPFKVPTEINGDEVDYFIAGLDKWEKYFRLVPTASSHIPSYSRLVDVSLCERYAKLVEETKITVKPSNALLKFATQLTEVTDCIILSHGNIHEEAILTEFDIETFKYLIKLIRKQPYVKPTN